MKPWAFLWLVACAAPVTLTDLEHTRDGDSQALRELARTDPDLAARAMGRIQSTAYLPDLMALLPNEQARDEAIFAIGQVALGDEWKDSFQVSVVTALNPYQATSPALVAEALGKAKVKPPADLVEHKDRVVRRKAAVALWRSRGEAYSDLALQQLKRLARDADPEVRYRATFAFSRPFEPRAVDVLIERLQDAEGNCRLFAARALGQAKGFPLLKEIVAALQPLTKDSDPAVRIEAVNAIVQLEGAVPIGLMEDTSLFVRAAAAPLFIDKALQSGSATVRRQAALALGRAVKAELPAALDELSLSKDWRDRVAAADALIGKPVAMPVLERLTHDPDERVQAAAIASTKGLKECGGDALAMAALKAKGLSVRATAVDVLRDSTTPEVRTALRESYRDSKAAEYDEIREDLVDIFAGWGTDELLLRTVLADDPSPKVKAKAAKALKAPVPLVPGPAAPAVKSFDKPPRYRIDTNRGSFEIELFPDQALQHVSSFDALVDKKFYDGLLWHRVVPNFVVQGGDPRGDGWGNGGVHVDDEINRVEFERGIIGMPKSTKDSGGCQLFITHLPTPHLDGRYTAFGQVMSGMEVVDDLEVGDRIEHIFKLR